MVMVTVKVLEEWGFNIGDDACLFDEDGNGTNEEHDDLEEVRSDHDQVGNADFLVDKIVKEFVEAEGNASLHDGVVDLLVPESVSDKVERQPVLSEPIVGRPVGSTEPGSGLAGGQGSGNFLEGRGISASACPPDVGLKYKTKHENRSTTSCPPGAARSLGSGLWSLEWLSDQHLSESVVVSSSRNIATKGSGRRGGQDSEADDVLKRKKVKGVLRHPVHSLKRVARLPQKDRAAVMKFLIKILASRKGPAHLRRR